MRIGALPDGTILDGEVCVLDDIGRSDFERVHARSRRRGIPPGADGVVYSVFDLLVLASRDLRQRPLLERKAALQKLLDGLTQGEAPGRGAGTAVQALTVTSHGT